MKVELLTGLCLHTDYHKKWLYATTSPMSYRVTGLVIPDCNVSHDSRLLADVRKNVITIHKGYAYDGMTNFPDDAANLTGALLHDFLYQTALVSRKHADKLLTATMRATGANHGTLVYCGVRLFGWLHYGSEKGIRIVKL